MISEYEALLEQYVVAYLLLKQMVDNGKEEIDTLLQNFWDATDALLAFKEAASGDMQQPNMEVYFPNGRYSNVAYHIYHQLYDEELQAGNDSLLLWERMKVGEILKELYEEEKKNE